MLLKKLAFLLRGFSAENLLRLFKNRSKRAQTDENDTKFVLCIKNWFFGIILRLTHWATLPGYAERSISYLC